MERNTDFFHSEYTVKILFIICASSAIKFLSTLYTAVSIATKKNILLKVSEAIVRKVWVTTRCEPLPCAVYLDSSMYLSSGVSDVKIFSQR